MNVLRTIRNTIRRGHRREEGQAAFEFLMMLPFFVLFLLLVIDFGVLMYQYVSVSNAVREGARYAAVNCGDGSCDEADVQQWVLDRSGGILDDVGDVTVGWADGSDSGTGDGNSDRGDSVVVRVEHSHTLLFFPHTFNVTSCSEMRLEQRDRTSGLPTATGCD